MKKFFVILAAVAMIANVACTKVNPEEKKAEKIIVTTSPIKRGVISID